MLILCLTYNWQRFSLCCRFYLLSGEDFFCCADVLISSSSHLSSFRIISCANGVISKMFLPLPTSWNVSHSQLQSFISLTPFCVDFFILQRNKCNNFSYNRSYKLGRELFVRRRIRKCAMRDIHFIWLHNELTHFSSWKQQRSTSQL